MSNDASSNRDGNGNSNSVENDFDNDNGIGNSNSNGNGNDNSNSVENDSDKMTIGLAIHQKHDDQCAWQQENSRRETKQVSSKLP